MFAWSVDNSSENRCHPLLLHFCPPPLPTCNFHENKETVCLSITPYLYMHAHKLNNDRAFILVADKYDLSEKTFQMVLCFVYDEIHVVIQTSNCYLFCRMKMKMVLYKMMCMNLWMKYKSKFVLHQCSKVSYRITLSVVHWSVCLSVCYALLLLAPHVFLGYLISIFNVCHEMFMYLSSFALQM